MPGNFWEQDEAVGNVPMRGTSPRSDRSASRPVMAFAPKGPGDKTPPPEKLKRHYRKVLFDEFLRQGLSREGAKTMIAHIGRENSFRSDELFKTHEDPENHKINMGMISWQGDRAEALKTFMAKRGLLEEDGQMIKSDDALRSQVQFMTQEMDDESLGRVARQDMSWRSVKKALMDPRKKYQDLQHIVGKNYIAWAWNNPKYKHHYRNMLEFYNLSSSELDEEASLTAAPKPAAPRRTNSVPPRLARPPLLSGPLNYRLPRHTGGGLGGGGGGGW